MSPKFGFWMQAFFAALNISLFFFTSFDWASPFNLAAGLFCAWGAYRLRQYA